MKKKYILLLSVALVGTLFMSSCKDKKKEEQKAAVPVEVKAPETVAKTDEVTSEAKAEPVQNKPSVKSIVVKKGEWLYDISRREYGNIYGWKKIYEANKAIINNPDLIFPNQELIIPE